MKTEAELAAIFDEYGDTQVEWLGADLFARLYRALDEAFRDVRNRDALRDSLDKLGDVAPRLPPTDKAICRIAATGNEIGNYGMFASQKTAEANVVALLDPKLDRAIRRAVKLIGPRITSDLRRNVELQLGLAKPRAHPHIVARKWVRTFLANLGLNSDDADEFGSDVATQLVEYGRKPPTPEEVKVAREKARQAKIAYELGEMDKPTYDERVAKARQLIRAASAPARRHKKGPSLKT